MADLDMYGALDLEIPKAARSIRACEALLDESIVRFLLAADNHLQTAALCLVCVVN
jgi:hypothetical protein